MAGGGVPAIQDAIREYEESLPKADEVADDLRELMDPLNTTLLAPGEEQGAGDIQADGEVTRPDTTEALSTSMDIEPAQPAPITPVSDAAPQAPQDEPEDLPADVSLQSGGHPPSSPSPISQAEACASDDELATILAQGMVPSSSQLQRATPLLPGTVSPQSFSLPRFSFIRGRVPPQIPQHVHVPPQRVRHYS